MYIFLKYLELDCNQTLMKKKVFSWIRKLTFCRNQVSLILDPLWYLVVLHLPSLIPWHGT